MKNGRPQIIDTAMHGYPGITAAYVIRGEKTALVETGPKSVVANVFTGLEDLGIEDLDWIVVTHIHLDHAGAAGTLAKRFPNATIAVHEIGAPHLVDPSKLWSSATRIYGDMMDKMWGGIDPIDEDRIQVLRDGDKVDLGGRTLQSIETPGHARHHHAFLDDATGIVLTGDALGVRLPDIGIIRPATPPPEFHLEHAVNSIERIRGLGATSLWPTHFGPIDEGTNVKSIDETCDEAIDVLHRWAAWVREARSQTDDLDKATAIVQERAGADMGAKLTPDAIERMEQTTSYRMNVSGYLRYLSKFED